MQQAILRWLKQEGFIDFDGENGHKNTTDRFEGAVKEIRILYATR